MIVTIHQPELWPHLGLLDKARRADVFVLLDDCQFRRDGLQHRAKIAPLPGRAGTEFAWLTIPFVHAHPQLIRDVQFADPLWADQHRMMVRAVYGEAPGFAAAWPAIEAFYACPGATVAEAATASVRMLFKAFGIAPGRVVTSTELGSEGTKGDRVLDLCKRLGATCYLSGRGGATYLDAEMFAAAGVSIEVQSFTPPEGLAREVPCLSALDAWMRLGERAPEVFA